MPKVTAKKITAEAQKVVRSVKTTKPLTMWRVERRIKQTPKNTMCKGHKKIVKFIAGRILAGKKLATAKVEDHGYAVPYLVRDIIVEGLKHHCQHHETIGKTPHYWMAIICDLFKKIPFKYYDECTQYDDESDYEEWDEVDEIKQDFDVSIYDDEGLIKKKKEDGKDLSKEEEAELDACYVTWNYTLPSFYGPFMLGMEMGFTEPINDVLRENGTGVIVHCAASLFRDGSEYALVCGYDEALSRLL